MVASQTAFVSSDTMVKVLSGSLGLGQILLVRGIFASMFISFIVWRMGELTSLHRVWSPAIALRILGEIGATYFFLMALTHMPIANVQAIYQVLPLAITMCAALFLGEQVGPRRWLAIAFGFMGVMLIVQPGMSAFDSYALYVLASVACSTVRDLATRRIPTDMPSSFVSMLTAIPVTLFGGFLVVAGDDGWQSLSPSLLVLLGTTSIFLLIGYQALVISIRVGDLSYVAPFRYTALVWAILSGLVVFGNIPDLPMLIGSTIVVSSGIYALYREKTVGKSQPIAQSTKAGIAPDGL